MHQAMGDFQSLTHPRPSECDSRQTIQTGQTFKQNGFSIQRSSKQYAPDPGGTSPKWTCLPPGSSTNCQFVSPVPDPQYQSALSLSWEDLDLYAFLSVAILGKVVEKLQDYPCNRIILIAPGWPNMPWFWDLVAISSQIPLCLPNLLTPPFKQTLHRKLNMHAWLLEHHLSRSRASLRQWQDELRLLKEDQPDQSMRQKGQFYKVVDQ